jgi:hypothetical protein
MRRNWKYKALIAVAVAALVVGGATAIARSTSHRDHPARPRAALAHLRHSGVLTVAANYLGETRAQLRHELQVHHTLGQLAEATTGHSAAGLVAALASAKATKLKAAVTNGKLTAAKERADAAALHARAAAAVARPRAVATARGELAIAAGYLGLSSAQLRHEHKSGRSLAEVADARAGKSAAGLIEAIVSHKAEPIAAAAGVDLSPAHKKMLLAQLRRRVTAAVNRARAKAPAKQPAG